MKIQIFESIFNFFELGTGFEPAWAFAFGLQSQPIQPL